MKTVGIQILTDAIQNLRLNSILLALGRKTGLASIHQDSRPLMVYAVEYMCPTIYDWSSSLLSNMKYKLTESKMGWVRNFGYGSILSAFFFEHVPGLIPREDISLHGVRDPAYLCWENVM